MTKPFSLEEVWPGSGRSCAAAGPAPPRPAPARRFADIELDEDTHEVWQGRRSRSSCRRPSSSCCATSWHNAGRVLSKAQILDHVWHYDFGGEANVVESYVSYLRRKVDTTEPRLIHTCAASATCCGCPREPVDPARPALRRAAAARPPGGACCVALAAVGLLVAGVVARRRAARLPGRRGRPAA